MKAILAVASLLALSTPAMAESRSELCDARARAETGYRGGHLPAVRMGPVTLRFSGSIAFGVTGGNAPATQVPRGAGSGARELRDQKARAQYDRAYSTCVAGL